MLRIMKTKSGLMASLAFVLSIAVFAPLAIAAQDIAFAKGEGGVWSVKGPGYTATINKDGYLSSVKVGEIETLGAPLAYQPSAKLVADSAEPADNVLNVHLKGPSAEATIAYEFRPDGFTISPTLKGSGFAEFRVTGSPSLLGIELLNDKSPLVGDAMSFTDQGEIRGVPAAGSSRNQMVRFHYPGFGLHAYVQAWGAPFNYESAGSISGNTWGRPLLSANRPFPIVFAIQKSDQTYSLPAVPFVPRTTKVASLYYVEEPKSWTIDLGAAKAYQYLLDAGVKELQLSWTVTDIHDKVVGQGGEKLALAADKTSPVVNIQTQGSGYHQVLFELSDAGKKMQPSSFRTRFTVIHQVPGMINRPDDLAGKAYTDYAVVAMIGTGAVRESHTMVNFFKNEEPKGDQWVRVEGAEPAVWMDTKALDGLMNGAVAESTKYKLKWLFQANERPKWATPAQYEAMAFAMVSRYKDRCKVWEVENEPNFSYRTPKAYMEQAVIPFQKGAKRADPDCIIMGPGCVGLVETLRFMEYIYAEKLNGYFDNISTHTYPGPGESWERHGNLAMIAKLKDWMKANGDGDKPLWQTEQGYAWDSQGKLLMARHGTRQFLCGAMMGIDPSRQYYFYPQAHGFESWYQTGGGEAGSESSWLPVAAGQRFFAEATFGTTFKEMIPSPYKGIYLARFAGQNEDVVAAWTFDITYLLQAQVPNPKSISDFMGNPVLLTKSEGLLSLPLSGEPMYIRIAKDSPFTVQSQPFGRNVALSANGGTASASSSARERAASNAIDGNWELWQNAADLPGRTAWQSDRIDPTTENPDWLQISFAVPRKIDRIAALCYQPAVNCTPRDFEFQAQVDGKWQTVGGGKGETGWVFYREFPAITATAIRMNITAINDGFHMDRKWMHVLMGPTATRYTDSKVAVAEFEAYGPQTELAVTASVAEPRKFAAFTAETVNINVANPSGKAVKGKLQVATPEGWRAEPAALDVDIPAGTKQKDLTLKLTPPPALATGPNYVQVKFVNDAGTAIDSGQLVLEVVAPVQLVPQAPDAYKPAEQPLAVTVKNLTKEPLSGTIELSLDTAQIVQARQPFGPIEPKGSATVNFVVKNLPLVGSSVQATYSARANGLMTSVTQQFAVRGWQTVGPFPNEGGSAGFDKAYGPEEGVDLEKTYIILDGQAGARWKPIVADDNGYYDLRSRFQPNTNVVAYAVVYARSPDDRKAVFSCGFDDGAKVWLNGKQVFANSEGGAASPGEHKVPGELKAGWNEVLVKVTQGGGGWGFYADFTTPDGKPMNDLIYSDHKGQ